MVAQKNPVWSSNGVEWAGSEVASSEESYEHDVGNLALEVVGQNWSSEVIFVFLEDWEVGRAALGCCSSTDFLCQEMTDVCRGGLRVAGFPRVQSARKEGGGVLMPRFFLSV